MSWMDEFALCACSCKGGEFCDVARCRIVFLAHALEERTRGAPGSGRGSGVLGARGLLLLRKLVLAQADLFGLRAVSYSELGLAIPDADRRSDWKGGGERGSVTHALRRMERAGFLRVVVRGRSGVVSRYRLLEPAYEEIMGESCQGGSVVLSGRDKAAN